MVDEDYTDDHDNNDFDYENPQNYLDGDDFKYLFEIQYVNLEYEHIEVSTSGNGSWNYYWGDSVNSDDDSNDEENYDYEDSDSDYYDEESDDDTEIWFQPWVGDDYWDNGGVLGRKNPELANYSSEPEWYINIGVPIGNYDETDKVHKDVYNVVLNVGYQFSSSSEFSERISLEQFQIFYLQHEKDYLSNLNSISELYAEILMYHQDNMVPEGFYAIVDVGGGTVDVATFYKYISKEEGTQVECISQKVESLGIESLINRIANNADCEEDREQIREYLIETLMNYNNDDYSIKDLKSPYINRHSLYLIRKQFRTVYGSCLMDAKKKRRVLMAEQKDNAHPLKCFLLGGGKDLSFYSQAIRHMAWAHNNAGFPQEEIVDIKTYIQNNPDLKVKGNRLIISQMLAQPYEKIPPIKDMPWHFDMTE
ncbi:hypothetical protein [Treponema sp.]|uniref:hypothetical protein n=1 Tax=Treponema sp. TaxID=166 RepID=UPI003FD81398